ncbi:MAG: hypothetical protein OEQ24_06725 [Gammaproteobacteria bacterium]|nr:hypothetical protein [Gammaproteobacteria bacterium]
MKQWSLVLLLGLTAFNLNAADLSAEQVEQQIQLSHMLGQISQKEQNYRIQKVRTLGVDGYYEWLQNDTRPVGKTAVNSSE